jgi:capsule polysaccharide export protein KpsC/LpsZ
MRVVGAEDSVNTYDLVALADLGLVYTTTVGLEMAMSGLPVIVAGETHYRGKGFTTDPSNWEEYFSALDRDLANLQSAKLDQRQIDMAWHYAYRFFFDYPQPYPWHLLHFWKDAESTPLNQIFSEAGQAKYARTFDHLLGQPFEWD